MRTIEKHTDNAEYRITIPDEYVFTGSEIILDYYHADKSYIDYLSVGMKGNPESIIEMGDIPMYENRVRIDLAPIFEQSMEHIGVNSCIGQVVVTTDDGEEVMMFCVVRGTQTAFTRTFPYSSVVRNFPRNTETPYILTIPMWEDRFMPYALQQGVYKAPLDLFFVYTSRNYNNLPLAFEIVRLGGVLWSQNGYIRVKMHSASTTAETYFLINGKENRKIKWNDQFATSSNTWKAGAVVDIIMGEDGFYHAYPAGEKAPIIRDGLNDIDLRLAANFDNAKSVIIANTSGGDASGDFDFIDITPSYEYRFADTLCKDGVHLRWRDPQGYLQYFTFAEGDTTTKTKDGGVSRYAVQTYPSNTFYRSGRKVATIEKKCSAVGIDENDFEWVKTIAESTEVDIYHNGEWKPVNVADTSITFARNKVLHNIELTLTLDEYVVQ